MKKLARTLVVLGLLVLLALPMVPVQAASGISVSFDVIKESPVETTIRATITNLAGAPAKNLSMEALLGGLSIPLFSLNQIRMELVTKQSYIVDIPVYGKVALTDAERLQWMESYFLLAELVKPANWDTLTLQQKVDWFASQGITVPTEEYRVIYTYPETRYREVREDFKDWYFKGTTPKTTTTIGIPSNLDNEYGWGPGILVLDVTVNTGTVERTDAGGNQIGWGSKGILSLNIDGKVYKDLTASSWWDANWQYRNVLSFEASTISEDLHSLRKEGDY